jgi:hypothetical protein
MPSLLSGNTLRSGGSNTFINLKGAQPQFPPDADQTTGYTITTNNQYITTTTNTLGNLVHYKGVIYSNIPNGNIVFTGTGTGTVIVSQPTLSTSTVSGALVVNGGIGVGGNMVINNDITVNGITIGQGFQGVNNITIDGIPPLDPGVDAYNGQQSIRVGWGTLEGISSSDRVIAIGVNAIGTGTNVKGAIALGDNALNLVGTLPSNLVLPITGATNTNPLTLTVNGHYFTTGTEVTIAGATGMTEINNNIYYVSYIDPNTVSLYSDNILNNSVDATGFGSYIGSGTIYKVLAKDFNIGIGINAGASLYDGSHNFFMGDNIASNFESGNSNFFLGHEVANNMITGNANISLLGDNLVDGLSNQISIGAIFYYNGSQLLNLETDVVAGLGTESTSTTTGALVVQGGVGIAESLNIGVSLTAAGPGQIVLSPEGGNVSIEPTVGGSVTIFPASLGAIDNVEIGFIEPQNGTFLDIIGQTLRLDSNNNAINTESGALHVIGGASIGADTYIGGQLWVQNGIVGIVTTATNIYGGAEGSLPYQLDYGVTDLLPIGSSGYLLLSDGTKPYWGSVGNISAGTATNALNIFVGTATSPTLYYPTMARYVNDYSDIWDTPNVTYNASTSRLTVPNATVSSTITATSTTSGALQVVGGAGIQGNVYSNSGNFKENYLLYTLQTTLQIGVPPSNPKLGDFWIDPSQGATFQYVLDGTNKVWVQFTGL